MAPPFPSERKLVERRTGLLTRATQAPTTNGRGWPASSYLPGATLQWYFRDLIHLDKELWLALLDSRFLSSTTVPVVEGIETRGAYSCGAVADFHRLPEHPDDCGCNLSRPDGAETLS